MPNMGAPETLAQFDADPRFEVVVGTTEGETLLVLNQRRDLFKDVRVRQALAEAFDFEWINNTLNRGAYARIRSPFGGTPLGFEGAAEGSERKILAPFADDLPEGALGSDFAWPETDGEGRSRRNLRKAARLLAEAGWQIQNGVLMGPERKRFRFEILLSGPAWEPAAQVFAKSLSVLGIQATVRLVDGAQYQARRSDYDYDMIVNTWAMSLSPGNEQRFYWGREGVTAPGTRNYPGVDSPAAEAAIDALLAAEDAPAGAQVARPRLSGPSDGLGSSRTTGPVLALGATGTSGAAAQAMPWGAWVQPFGLRAERRGEGSARIPERCAGGDDQEEAMGPQRSSLGGREM